jgi:hypothetical protein
LIAQTIHFLQVENYRWVGRVTVGAGEKKQGEKAERMESAKESGARREEWRKNL